MSKKTNTVAFPRARPAALAFDVFDNGTPTFDGKALRKQVTIYFTASRTEHHLDLLVCLPAKVTGPAPVLLNFGWGANNLAVPSDPGLKVGRRWDNPQRQRVPAVPIPPAADAAAKKGGPGRNIGNTLLTVLERGYGFAIFNYTDVDPDALNATAHGIRAAYLKPGQAEPAPDEWGSIAA